MYSDCDNISFSFTDLDILRDTLLPLADDLSPQLTFALSDEDEYSDELKTLGFDDWGEDVAIAIWASSREKYRMTEDFDSESLREFIQVSVWLPWILHQWALIRTTPHLYDRYTQYTKLLRAVDNIMQCK